MSLAAHLKRMVASTVYGFALSPDPGQSPSVYVVSRNGNRGTDSLVESW